MRNQAHQYAVEEIHMIGLEFRRSLQRKFSDSAALLRPSAWDRHLDDLIKPGDQHAPARLSNIHKNRRIGGFSRTLGGVRKGGLGSEHLAGNHGVRRVVGTLPYPGCNTVYQLGSHGFHTIAY